MVTVSDVIQKWRFAQLDYAEARHCVAFVAEGVAAKSGRPVLDARVLKAKGLRALANQRKKVLQDESLEAYLDARFAPINPLEAEEGDIVAFPADDTSLIEYSLGLGAGAGFVAAFVPLPDGRGPVLLIDKALGVAVKAWRVEKEVPCPS
jgi:hypothetical protein